MRYSPGQLVPLSAASICLVAALELGACHNGGGDIGGSRNSSDAGSSISAIPSKPALYLEPGDRRTNVQADSIMLWVDDSGGLAATRAQLDELAAKMKISRWPEGSAIEITTSIDSAAARGGSEIHVTPMSTLVEGWYLLSLGNLDGSLMGFRTPGVTLPSDGTYSSRFRIGSEPDVVDIRVCSASDSSRKVIVDLSEEAEIIQPLEDHVQLTTTAGPAQCTSTTTGVERATSINLACDGLRDQETLTVALIGAFASLSMPGRPAPRSTVEYHFRLQDLENIGGQCHRFLP